MIYGYFGSGTAELNAIRKYGKQNITREILRVCFNSKELNYWEAYYTLLHQTDDRKYGYNSVIGHVFGIDGLNHNINPEVKIKIKQSNIKFFKSKSGKQLAKKRSQWVTQYWKSEQGKLQIEQNKVFFDKFYNETPEGLVIKQKMSNFAKARTGTNNSGFQGKVIMFSLDLETVKVFESRNHAAEVTGYNNDNISGAIRGRTTHYKGFIWRNFEAILFKNLIKRKTNSKPIKHRIEVQNNKKYFKVILLEDI